jgi:hypothetical protein
VDFGVTKTTIASAVLGATWAAVPGAVESTRNSGERNGQSKLTAAQAREVYVRYKAGGISLAKLGAEYGVTYGVVQQIVSGKTWKRETKDLRDGK